MLFRREKELVKATETPEEKRARRLKKKEEKERKKRAKMGWDQEMMVATSTVVTACYISPTRAIPMPTTRLVTPIYWAHLCGTRWGYHQ